MVCERCGSVDHFRDELLDGLRETLRLQHDFLATRAHIAVFGLCRNCRLKSTES
jgi:Fe2+ or Zn2+ uptake regulation protein